MSKELSSILNFRDVGCTINQESGSESIREGLLYRCAQPDDASHEDRIRLRDVYKIKTVIDLRTRTEHIQNEKKREARQSAAAATDDSSAQSIEPRKVSGIEYAEVNFIGSAYTNSLLKKLSWYDYFRLIALMVTGYRIEGLRIVGEKVMNEQGLLGLARDSIDYCTNEVREVFDILSEPDNFPVLVHCTHGKDRAGLVVQLVLMLLGIEEELINSDYMLSGPGLASQREERLSEVRSIGLNDDFANCNPELVHVAHEHIRQKYGSIDGYLEHCGVTKQAREQVKQVLQSKSD